MTSSFVSKGLLMTSVDNNLAPVDEERDDRSNAGFYALGGLAIIAALVWALSFSWV